MQVYRTAGRAPDEVAIPRPPPGAFWLPLGRGVLCLIFALVPPIVFNLVAPLLVPRGTSLVPTLDFIQNGIAVAMLASVPALLVVVWRRVRPVWRALWLPTKIAYVTALLATQLAMTAGAEYALFESRGGLDLFGPVLKSTTTEPGGRTAFVYTPKGFSCGWTVKTAGRFSPLMEDALSVSRASCAEAIPIVHFEPDGTIDLLDVEGKRLEPQASPGFSFWGGGC